MLLDPFNRRLNYLRLSLTDRCNLRCLYCMPEGGVPKLAHGDILSYEEFLRSGPVKRPPGHRKDPPDRRRAPGA